MPVKCYAGYLFYTVSEMIYMKNFPSFLFAVLLVLASCNGSGNQANPKSSDTTVNNGGPDSAANNGILPPSGAVGNANNSSLSDTSYKARDSSGKKSKK